MTVYPAREEIIYTPLEGEPLVLLRRGDMLRAPVLCAPEYGTEDTACIGRSYRHLRAVDGVVWGLTVEVFARFATLADAERLCAEHAQALALRRAGELGLSTAYYGEVPTLVQRWDAVLTGHKYTRLTAEANPELADEEGRVWMLLNYTFKLTNLRSYGG